MGQVVWPFRSLLLEATERRAQIVQHGFEAAVQRSSTANYHIIMVRSHGCDIQPLHQFAKPAANAVAFRGGSDFLSDGKTDSNRAIVITHTTLNHEGRACHSRSMGCCDEIRTLFQPVHDLNDPNRSMKGLGCGPLRRS